MIISDSELYQLLLENEFLSEKQLKEAKHAADEKKVPFETILIEDNFLSDENLGKLVADHVNLPFISLSRVVIPPAVLRIIPPEFAQKHHLITFAISDQGVKVATSEVNNQEILQLIAQKTQHPVLIYSATSRDIESALTLYKQELQTTFNDLLKHISSVDKDVPIAQILHTLIDYAYDSHASDIHIEPEKEGSIVRFRIDGILHTVLNFSIVLHEQLVTGIKIESRLRTDEHFGAQDGKMQLKLSQEEVDIRVSIVPIVEGEKCVLRLLTSHNRQFGLSDLGMNDIDLEKVQRGFKKPYGMVLSTGPTGSGKTTSIYAILKVLNTPEINIATIEDPVEYEIEHINQIQVNPKTNLTFAAGLRSILRQDPNIIYVGEIRDHETADIAINSAMTGHLVLSTLHTNDAVTTLPRLIDMGIEPFLVASTVNVIIAQRLIRKICDKCAVSFIKKPEDLQHQLPKEFIERYFGTGTEIRLFHGAGCPVCHGTGYRGRIGIFEVLEVSEAIQKLIAQKADVSTIQKQAIKEGMTTMLKNGTEKVQLGVTTIEEVLRETRVQHDENITTT